MSRLLTVYLHDEPVGCLEQTNSGDLAFTYHAHYQQRAAYGISLSLPLNKTQHTGTPVKAFFAGLLPEESVRNRLAKYLGLSEKNAFALLEAVGGDCAGALALYPEGESPRPPTDEATPLDATECRTMLDLIKRRPMLAGDGGYRLSLAGAQDKLAVGFKDGQIQLIKGGAPTTHILKPLITGVKDSAHNELFCMQLATRLGLDVPEASLQCVEDTPYYLVARYDRKRNKDGTITRIHQEDFCQALAMAPEIKYEREGGPSIAACQDLIAEYAAQPAADQIKLVNRVLFNYLIGNADAHGKNFSLLYQHNKPMLAPAYDLLSTAIYPDLSQNMAMKIGGKYKPNTLSRRHFYALMPKTQAAQAAMDRLIKKMTTTIVEAAPTLKAELIASHIKSSVFDEIIKVIRSRVQRLTIS